MNITKNYITVEPELKSVVLEHTTAKAQELYDIVAHVASSNVCYDLVAQLSDMAEIEDYIPSDIVTNVTKREGPGIRYHGRGA